ncbi:MAG: tetratricopeptide repeat protein [Sphingobium sp.]|nr:tetratricopeptide repeat protein [Sphingobium sp.]MBP6110913.1 tetratricopeptide repeat protein [Sphingobium sp.]MBP8670611.1 tetratricopeptide repeat protein [Sphingobium sp.]MBP9157015.1 tetratricopeptide repeat protein [Sphingobium sp.]
MQALIDQALELARALPPADAEKVYHELLEIAPGNPKLVAALAEISSPGSSTDAPANPPPAVLDRAVTLYGQGRFGEALDHLAHVQNDYPDSEVLHNIAGAIFAASGEMDHALAHYDRALQLAPDYYEAHNNRGIALKSALRPQDALHSFECALYFKPDYAEAHMNRGIALGELGRRHEAIASHDRAISLNPDLAEAYNNRGNMLAALQLHAHALADFDRAIALKPTFADAFVNRGNVLKAMNRLDEAIASCDSAIAHAPALAQAHGNRGTLLKDQRRLDEALASQEQALRLNPESALAQAEVRNLRAQMCIWSEEDERPPLPVGIGTDAVPPFYMLHFADDPARQLECAQMWSAARYGFVRAAPLAPHPAKDKIRIGYFSADFHGHAVMYLLARLLELHDRARFEIHAFSYGKEVEDSTRERLTNAVDAFHRIGHLDDEVIAALVRDQRIDIAVDLNGHTEHTRPGIFAARVAPVQVNYLGYPGTSGAPFMDYIIADRFIIPEEHQHHYTEKVLYLPHCYQPSDDSRVIADRVFSRTELGLPEQGFVFCCFSNNYKIKRQEFDIWMRLLGTMQNSVLWLLKDNIWAADNLRREAEARGIAASRLVFADRIAPADHLARHRCADLFLDTFDVNAHTTASDALWAGLPLITKAGESFAARVAGSLLHAVGLPELVTSSPQEYEALALRLASAPAELTAVRDRLALNRLDAPLFDTPSYTRDLEQIYERLVETRV